jgi:adenosylhomocysteine nucleosidase
VSTSRVAIIAALPTETRELARTWPRQSVTEGGRTVQLAWSNDAVVASAGMGPTNALRALAAVRALTEIRCVLSIGFAGALTEDGESGQVFEPSQIIDSSTGERFETTAGDGSTLVTIRRVAGPDEKLRLASTYSAQCCDMEAAALARNCIAQRAPFYAIKAISDELDFSLPALEKFTTQDGQFRTVAFALYAAAHPGLWHPIRVLASGASAARDSLANAVGEWMTGNPTVIYPVKS